jgi:hypothetical protein
MNAQSTWDKLLESGLSDVLVVLLFCAGAVAVLTVAGIIGLLLYRWHVRPLRLPRQLNKEVAAIRTRQERLERNGPDPEAIEALEERIAFMESLVAGATDAALLPSRSKGAAAKRRKA